MIELLGLEVVVIEENLAVEHPPDPGRPPRCVMSHAIGKGVIWLSSLSVNHIGL